MCRELDQWAGLRGVDIVEQKQYTTGPLVPLNQSPNLLYNGPEYLEL